MYYFSLTYTALAADIGYEVAGMAVSAECWRTHDVDISQKTHAEAGM
jgi:hypothetical protein